jgi:uncharacterized protein with ACT and thioredoxin-like domain
VPACRFPLCEVVVRTEETDKRAPITVKFEIPYVSLLSLAKVLPVADLAVPDPGQCGVARLFDNLEISDLDTGNGEVAGCR